MKILIQFEPDSSTIDLGFIGDYTLSSSQWTYTLRAEMKQTSQADKDAATAHDGAKVQRVMTVERDGITTVLHGATINFSIHHDHIAFLAVTNNRSITQ